MLRFEGSLETRTLGKEVRKRVGWEFVQVGWARQEQMVADAPWTAYMQMKGTAVAWWGCKGLRSKESLVSLSFAGSWSNKEADSCTQEDWNLRALEIEVGEEEEQVAGCPLLEQRQRLAALEQAHRLGWVQCAFRLKVLGRV